MLLAETPSGILADRWSRKGVLILASIALAMSALVGGLSNNVPMYLVSAALWGIFFALYSGTHESIIYDTLLEHNQKSSRFEHYLGRIRMIDSAALVLGSILGGLLAHGFGLRAAYFLAIPVTVLSIIALIKFKEPRLHKAQVASPIKQHIQDTFRAALRKGHLAPVLIVLVAASVLTSTVTEFSQLWLITLAAPIAFYGPFNAIITSTFGIGGALASYLRLYKRPVMYGALLLMLISAMGLVFSQHLVFVVISLSLLCTIIIGINVVFTRLLHESLNSKVRAGAASTVGTIGRIFIIPLALSFGYISNEVDIFRASWLLVALVIVIIIYVLRTYKTTKELPSISPDDEISIDSYAR
ncbi:hypothetical protein BH23PAT1_BH23PAT1_2350 [soil metagenome]